MTLKTKSCLVFSLFSGIFFVMILCPVLLLIAVWHTMVWCTQTLPWLFLLVGVCDPHCQLINNKCETISHMLVILIITQYHLKIIIIELVWWIYFYKLFWVWEFFSWRFPWYEFLLSSPFITYLKHPLSFLFFYFVSTFIL